MDKNITESQKINDSFAPYLLRALYLYISDRKTTPLLIIYKNSLFSSPPLPEYIYEFDEYSNEYTVTFNISEEATNNLIISDSQISFEISIQGYIYKIRIPLNKNRVELIEEETGVGVYIELDNSIKKSLLN